LLLALASAVILRAESCGTHDHILLSQIRDSLNLEGQVPVFISHRNRVSQLYPQALGSLFVASYNSQGYGGGIRPRLHTGAGLCAQQWIYANHIENNSSSVVVFTARCIATEVIRLLPAYCGRCLAVDVLLFRAFASAGKCLATRYLAMGICVTISWQDKMYMGQINVAFTNMYVRNILISLTSFMGMSN
jgi:hypothetical protein